LDDDHVLTVKGKGNKKVKIVSRFIATEITGHRYIRLTASGFEIYFVYSRFSPITSHGLSVVRFLINKSREKKKICTYVEYSRVESYHNQSSIFEDRFLFRLNTTGNIEEKSTK